jgi:hypothetical protein
VDQADGNVVRLLCKDIPSGVGVTLLQEFRSLAPLSFMLEMAHEFALAPEEVGDLHRRIDP